MDVYSGAWSYDMYLCISVHIPIISFRLFQCMDLGYHNTLGRAMLMHVSAEDNIIQSRQACVNLMNKCIGDLEQRSDKHRFLELSHQPFAVPRRFDFQPHKGDEVSI